MKDKKCRANMDFIHKKKIKTKERLIGKISRITMWKGKTGTNIWEVQMRRQQCQNEGEGI